MNKIIEQELKKRGDLPGRNWFIKVIEAVSLFDFLDKLHLEGYPSDWAERFCSYRQKFSQAVGQIAQLYNWNKIQYDCWREEQNDSDFARKTGGVYSNLWIDFTAREYYEQAKDYLTERLIKNNISLVGVGKALDAGCGGGRYTLALKDLGCGQVIGLDISQDAIDFADKKNIFGEAIKFQVGSVLELPFGDNEFDFVFSNGVLHHTESVEKGLSEIKRVLKPEGHLWLYLYGGKGSVFWQFTDYCRELLKDVPQSYTQAVMRILGYAAGHIYYCCDFWYVPVNKRYCASEAETFLWEAGFRSWRRLNRGTQHDRDEILYAHPKVGAEIYGEGDLRYLAVK